MLPLDGRCIATLPEHNIVPQKNQRAVEHEADQRNRGHCGVGDRVFERCRGIGNEVSQTTAVTDHLSDHHDHHRQGKRNANAGKDGRCSRWCENFEEGLHAAGSHIGSTPAIFALDGLDAEVSVQSNWKEALQKNQRYLRGRAKAQREDESEEEILASINAKLDAMRSREKAVAKMLADEAG